MLFSFAVAYDAPGSALGDSVTAAGQRARRSRSPDPATVVIQLPVPFAPGVRILDNLPILPRHKLEAAFRNGTIQKAWVPATPLSEIAGLGPFVLTRARRRTAARLHAQPSLLAADDRRGGSCRTWTS